MSQTQHTATEGIHGASGSTPANAKPLAVIGIRVPEDLKWALHRIAVARKTTMTRLAARLLEDFVAANEKEAA